MFLLKYRQFLLFYTSDEEKTFQNR